MIRPEYIACIRKSSNRRHETIPACGAAEFAYFQSAEHATANRQNGGRLVACPDCLRALGLPDVAATEETLIDPADMEEEGDE